MAIDFTPEQEAAIVSRYAEGESVAALAREHGLSFRPIHRVLKAAGVLEPGRSRVGSRRYSKAQKTDMVIRYNQGESIHKLAKEFGGSPQLVWRVLRSLEVEFRDNAWKGGRIRAGADQSYVAVFADADDPIAQAMANVTGYVLEHRLVMARSLGRPLDKAETVHHINGDKLDNRLENLQLRQGKHGKGARFTCRDCGSHNVEATPL